MLYLRRLLSLKLGEEISISKYFQYQCLIEKDFLTEHMFRVYSINHIEKNTLINYFVIEKY